MSSSDHCELLAAALAFDAIAVPDPILAGTKARLQFLPELLLHTTIIIRRLFTQPQRTAATFTNSIEQQQKEV